MNTGKPKLDQTVNLSNRTVSEEFPGPITHADLQALHHNESTDPYLLRGLVWCGVCRRELVAVLVSSGARYYDCPTRPCNQTLVPAEELEQLVWHRFVLLNEVAAGAIKRNERQQALRDVLRRLTVHRGLADVHLEWRD